MNREPILIIADIIKDFLQIAADRILITNQDYNLPKDKDLFIVLQHTSTQPYSSVNRTSPTDDGYQEEINLLTREEYIINVMSKNSDARTRKEEIILALNSVNSFEQQEKYQFNIAEISNSFINVSELEGAGMFTRYAIKIVLMAWKNKVQDIAYYDNGFVTELETD